MLVVNELLAVKVTIAGSVDARIVNELLAVKVTIAGSVDARSHRITSCEGYNSRICGCS